MASKLYNLQLTEEELIFIYNAMEGAINVFRQGEFIITKNHGGFQKLGSIKAKTQKLINQINDDHN